jgi:hypothetical protein
MTTSIWFNHEGRKYYAKLALQNGGAKVLEAKTEEGRQVDPQFVQDSAIKAHKRINSWGGLPDPEEETLEETTVATKKGRQTYEN